ncbi:hypothetical protein [Pseudoalteromonas lipolytica]|uniref:Ankyrin repeat-containing protein n=1 Tax=Pseudoalteromonas lipolytica TaxID=570156 RepID=A0ABU8SZ43_9GAMM
MKRLLFFLAVLVFFLSFYMFYFKNDVGAGVDDGKEKTVRIYSNEIMAEYEGEKSNNIKDSDLIDLNEFVLSYATCNENVRELLNEKNEILTQLVGRVHDKNLEDSSVFLNYMVSSKVISSSYSTKIYEEKLKKEYFGSYDVVQVNEILNDNLKVNVLKRNEALRELIHNGEDLTAWLNENPNDDESFFLINDNEKLFISPDVIIGRYYNKLSLENKNALMSVYKPNTLMIKSAIEAGLSTDLIRELIENSSDTNHFLMMSNGKVSNLLLVALENKRERVLEFLLSSSSFPKPPFLTSPVNHYLSQLINSNSFDDKSMDMLALISKWDYFVKLEMNKGVVSLQGYNNLEIPNELISRLQELSIGNVIVDSIKEPSLEKLSQDDRYFLIEKAEIFNDYSSSLEDEAEVCRKIESSMLKLEPAFLPLSDIYSILNDNESMKANLKKLSKVSPALSDYYTSEFILSNLGSSEKKEVDDLLYNYTDLNYIIEIGSGLLVNQQNYLAERVFESFGLNALNLLLDRKWYIDFNQWSDSNYSVINKERVFTLYKSEKNKKMPSLLFSLLYERNYREAVSILSSEPEVYGFPYGRDSLHLMLDRIITFRSPQIGKNEKVILDYLLSKTKLNKFHFSRLRRLKIKDPDFFMTLSNIYPILNRVENYPYSQYLGQ